MRTLSGVEDGITEFNAYCIQIEKHKGRSISGMALRRNSEVCQEVRGMRPTSPPRRTRESRNT